MKILNTEDFDQPVQQEENDEEELETKSFYEGHDIQQNFDFQQQDTNIKEDDEKEDQHEGLDFPTAGAGISEFGTLPVGSLRGWVRVGLISTQFGGFGVWRFRRCGYQGAGIRQIPWRPAGWAAALG